MTDTKIIKSYVWHEEKCFYVSTIERDSSAALNPCRFYETIVWEFDWDTQERAGKIIGQEGSGRSLDIHFLICLRIRDTGDPNEKDD